MSQSIVRPMHVAAVANDGSHEHREWSDHGHREVGANGPDVPTGAQAWQPELPFI
jgi:hypothetical protein